MFRSAAYLALVLSHVAPNFGPRAEAAELLSELGVKHHVDPLLVIADVKHESDWLPGVVNQHSGTVGLMQIQPENDPTCRDHNPEVDGCVFVREGLLDWRQNLRVGVGYFEAARTYCQEHEHTSLAIYWLQIPLGDDAVRHARCGHRHGRPLRVPAAVRALLAERAELERIR